MNCENGNLYIKSIAQDIILKSKSLFYNKAIGDELIQKYGNSTREIENEGIFDYYVILIMSYIPAFNKQGVHLDIRSPVIYKLNLD